jgi:TolB protein
MLRRELGLLTVVVALGCTADAKPADNKRTVLVPAPGIEDADVPHNGRIAISKVVDGKAGIHIANADGSNLRRRTFGVWDASNVQMSFDGNWVMFGRDAGGSGDVLIVSADSGPERVVAASPINAYPSAWMHDGSGALYLRRSSRGASLWFYELAGGSSSQVFDVDGSVDDAFPTPDGKQIVYRLFKDGKQTIWVYDRVAKTHRQLTREGFERFSFLPISPDGKSLVYESYRTGTKDLWRLELATGEKRQLTQDIAEDWRGLWSPDGSRIAFLSNRGGQTDVWVLATGEADVQRVTDDTRAENTYGWTADGKGLIITVGLGHNHLYAIPMAGGPPVALTSGEWDVGRAVVSRDSQQIAFTGNKNGDDDIWVVGVGGGEPRLVAGGPGADFEPTWSPDGKRIAFTSNRSGNSDIWVVPTSGGTPTRLTDWPSGESAPRWSPTSDDIAFVSSHASFSDIWIVSARGGAPRRLTTMGTVNANFRWSRDGKSIAFSAASAGANTQGVYTVAATGGSPRLVSPAPNLAGLAWSPDGREIMVSRCRTGYCRIEVRSISGDSLRTFNTQEKVYEESGEWTPDGASVAITFQDLVADGKSLTADGKNLIAIRPVNGGPARLLEGPANHQLGLVGFAADGKTAIVTAVPYGNRLERIEVPPSHRR